MSLILVVDDEPDMRFAISLVLKKQGHSALEAGDGEAALAALGSQPVDLVLLDIRLPGKDGVQVLRDIRRFHQDLPVIMVSGYGSVETAVRVMEMGANGYLSKPFSNRHLAETVEKALEMKRLGQDRLHRGLVQKLSPGVSADGETSPAAPRRAFPRWAVGAALAAMALLAVFAGRSIHHKSIISYAAPFFNPTALAWEGGELWAADWVTQAVYRFKPRGDQLHLERTVSLQNSHITGLALAGDVLFTCDSWGKTIQKRRLDRDLSLAAEMVSPGPSPSALYWDGRYLWSCDSAQGRIYKHEPDDTLTVAASYPSPGKAPVGLFKDGAHLWSADAETGRLYKHLLDDKLTVAGEYELSEAETGREPLSAVAFHGRDWWIGRDGMNRLYRIGTGALRSAAPRPAGKG